MFRHNFPDYLDSLECGIIHGRTFILLILLFFYPYLFLFFSMSSLSPIYGEIDQLLAQGAGEMRWAVSTFGSICS